MNLYIRHHDAYNSAVNKFLRSKILMKMYIFPVKCARKEFFTVFTEKEITQLKLKIAGDYGVIGERENEKAMWQEVRDRLNDPDTKKHDKIVRYINAERKAERLRNKMLEARAAENKEENLDGVQ